jgi:hypothetical protein
VLALIQELFVFQTLIKLRSVVSGADAGASAVMVNLTPYVMVLFASIIASLLGDPVLIAISDIRTISESDSARVHE